MEHGPFQTTVAGGIASVVIDHPPLNLVDGAVIGGLIGLLDALAADPTVRVAVFRSADPDFFLMHGDVELLLALPPSTYIPVTEPNVAVTTLQRLATAPFVSIGVLDGQARGGGCEFLSALDLRIGSHRAVIGQPEVPMGILPGAGGTVRWPRIAGRSRALEILLTGRDLGAEEALAVGWLHTVVGPERVDGEADALARRIAAMPAASVAAVKRVIDASLAGGDNGFVVESDELSRLMASGNQREPMRRFLAAGGQTRQGETTDMAAIVGAMLDQT